MALMAAVSRLRLLLFELDDAIREAWRVIHRLYSGIDVRVSPSLDRLPSHLAEYI